MQSSLTDASQPSEVFLNWTRGSGWWNGRKWTRTSAEYSDGVIKAALPRCITAGYFTAVFANGVSFSTPVWQKDNSDIN